MLRRAYTVPLVNGVIAKPVRTLAVAIRSPRPLCKGITDSHDQSADWSRNDIVIHKVCVESNASARPTPYSPLLRFCRVWVFSCEIYTICL